MPFCIKNIHPKNLKELMAVLYLFWSYNDECKTHFLRWIDRSLSVDF